MVWSGDSKFGVDYEIRSAGKGKGMGVFALRKFDVGDKIIVERCVVSIGPPDKRTGETQNVRFRIEQSATWREASCGQGCHQKAHPRTRRMKKYYWRLSLHTSSLNTIPSI